MNVMVWAREPSLARAKGRRSRVAPSKAAFYEQCDVVSLHMRLVEDTRGIVTAADLSRMKPAALLVNTSRAQLIEPGALVEGVAGRAPRHGGHRRLRGRAPARPEPIHCSRWTVVCTPHIGYVTKTRYEVQFADVFDQIVAYARGSNQRREPVRAREERLKRIGHKRHFTATYGEAR